MAQWFSIYHSSNYTDNTDYTFMFNEVENKDHILLNHNISCDFTFFISFVI